MPAIPDSDLRVVAGFVNASDSALFTQFTGFTINTAEGVATSNAVAGRMTYQLPYSGDPAANNFGCIVQTNVQLKSGLMIFTGGYSNPLLDMTAGVKFEVYTNAAGDKAMRLYLYYGTGTNAQFLAGDTEFYTHASCPFPDGEFHTVVMHVTRTGWFVSIDSNIVLWLKAFAGTGLLTNTIYGRGTPADSHVGIMDVQNNAIKVNSVVISTTRTWGNATNTSAITSDVANGYSLPFNDTFDLNGTWNPTYGPSVPAITTDTLDGIAGPGVALGAFSVSGGQLSTAAGITQVLGADWNALKINKHGVLWEGGFQYVSGGWGLGLQISSLTRFYLFVNAFTLTASNIAIGYDTGTKSGWSYPLQSGVGTPLSNGTWVAFQIGPTPAALGSVRPDVATSFTFSAFASGASIGSFTFSAADGYLLNASLHSTNGAVSVMDQFYIARRSAMRAVPTQNGYPVGTDKNYAPSDASDAEYGATSQRGHLGAGEWTNGNALWKGRPASLYRGLDRITSRTEGG